MRAYESELYTPTQVVKHGDHWFIVDCWHHRIIYSDKLEKPIAEWKTLTDDIAGPHSIATDGKIYVTEDTGRHKLFVFAKTGTGYQQIQTVEGVGERPHRVVYDDATKRFYVVTSNSQEMFVYENQGGKLVQIFRDTMDFLAGQYTRSVTIMDGLMYFVSGDSKIVSTKYKDLSFEVVKEYPVPPELKQGNDLVKIQNYYYITATPGAFVRVRNLEDLATGQYEDLKEKLGFRGTPYYFYVNLSTVILPEITDYSGIKSFDIVLDRIVNLKTIGDYGPPEEWDIERKAELPV